MKLKSSQRKSIAAIPTAFKGQERRYAQSVSENLDTLSGRRGNIIDRAVTFRDLLDSGVLKLAGGILSEGGIDVTNPNDPNSDENGPIQLPTKPDNLTVTGGFESMFLGWSLPPYNGHDYIEIFRFASDNIVSAESAGAYTRYYGDQYFYVDENVGNQETWYYWVRAVNKNGVTGPFNSSAGTVGTSALDYVYISGLIDDIIADDINNLGLNTTIDALSDEIEDLDVEITSLENFTGYSSTYSGDSLIVRMGSVETVAGNAASSAQLQVETTARTTADTALSGRATTLESTVNNTTTGVAATYAGLQTEQTTRANADTALSNDITTLDSAFNNPTTGLPATRAQLQTEQTTRASADTALSNDITTLDSAFNNPTTGLSATRSQLQTESTTRSTADTALSNRATNLESTVNNANTGVAATYAGLQSEQTARSTGDTALSNDITTLTSTVNGHTSSISTQASTINGIQSKYAVKIDNNGHVSGFGLISTANNHSAGFVVAPTSSFVINADRFALAAPYNSNSTVNSNVGTNIPFKVITTPTVINGETIPVGVYIDDAFIHNAQITDAVIADATITSAKIFDLSATRISSGQISMDNSNNIAIFQGKRTFVGYSSELQKNIYTVNFASTAAGFALGNNNGNPYFHIGNATNYLKFDGSTMSVTGASINDLSVTTLQIGPNAVTVPDGDDATGLSINVAGSFVNVDSGYTYLSDWDVNGVPSSFLITGNVQFVGTNTSNQTSRPATAGIRFVWDWKTNLGAWSPAGTNEYNKTVGQQSLAQTFGGQAVSTTKIDVPSWSRGMRIRIQARNNSNYGGSGSTSRKLTGYGYFIVAAKR